MNNTLDKTISLGFGLVAAGKEQIEKTMNELVKKGEVTQAESKSLIDQLVQRGDEMKRNMESMIKERVQSVLIDDKKLATVEQLEALERRVQLLEQKETNS